jgi:hypothetical protein
VKVPEALTTLFVVRELPSAARPFTRHGPEGVAAMVTVVPFPRPSTHSTEISVPVPERNTARWTLDAAAVAAAVSGAGAAVAAALEVELRAVGG